MQIILFIGIPGTGKSSLYKERFYRTHLRLNLDMLRTRHREQLLYAPCLEGKTLLGLAHPGWRPYPRIDPQGYPGGTSP